MCVLGVPEKEFGGLRHREEFASPISGKEMYFLCGKASQKRKRLDKGSFGLAKGGRGPSSCVGILI